MIGRSLFVWLALPYMLFAVGCSRVDTARSSAAGKTTESKAGTESTKQGSNKLDVQVIVAPGPADKK